MFKFVLTDSEIYKYSCDCGDKLFFVGEGCHRIYDKVDLTWDVNDKGYVVVLDFQSYFTRIQYIKTFNTCKVVLDEYARLFNKEIEDQLKEMYSLDSKKFKENQEEFLKLNEFI